MLRLGSVGYQHLERCEIAGERGREREYSRPSERFRNARPQLSHLRTLLFDRTLSVLVHSPFQVCTVKGEQKLNGE